MIRPSYELSVVAVFLAATAVEFAAAPANAQPASATDGTTASVVSYDAQGRPIIRAIHVPEGLQIDGNLDEPLYRDVIPVSEFYQMEPNPGEPSTERTEVWVAYDADHVYVSVRCWDSQPEERWIVNEMRRDDLNVVRNENVAIMFDTFFDRRNGALLEMNPLGGIWDGLVENEQAVGADWNPVWDRRAGRFDGGWTAEMAVPFKSLRYQAGEEQTWGFNLRRTIRWKNEEAYMLKMPVISSMSGSLAIVQISNAATLVGLQVPSASNNIEIKPYVLSSLTTDRLAQPVRSNDPDGDIGVDVKYGITQNLTADFTYNTDFAQVEVDTAQVNLTRFSLFFPEKREFFLEGQGIFNFGGTGGFGAGGAPILFFSRRIGLEAGQPISIDAGGRLTGRIGPYTVGAINVQTGDHKISGTPATNFSVLRVKRDIFGRSSVGALFTGRSNSTVAPGSAQTYGVDTVLRLHEFATVNAYLAKTTTPGHTDNDTSHRVRFQFSADRYGLEVERRAVGGNFIPDVGFLRRDDYTLSFVSARFSPRPVTSFTSVRQFTYSAAYELYEDGAGRMESRDINAQFQVAFHNTDMLSVRVNRVFEFLDRPFRIAPDVAMSPGEYPFTEAQVSYTVGNTRRFSGNISVSGGTFYSGNRKTIGVTSGRVVVSPQVSLEPGVSINVISLREGDFTSTVLSSRVTYTFTPLMFLSGLLQYNSTADTVGSNVRLRWEYQPGSELFLVYTDELNTRAGGYPDLRNRTLVLKINRLFRF